jgi:hypothetical protein
VSKGFSRVGAQAGAKDSVSGEIAPAAIREEDYVPE